MAQINPHALIRNNAGHVAIGKLLELVLDALGVFLAVLVLIHLQRLLPKVVGLVVVSEGGVGLAEMAQGVDFTVDVAKIAGQRENLLEPR